ncbi:2-succinyl-6-hydroxy-2,4-cyclohexadiene-1-carboxylate synthase [Thaumasiovibrio subtropicus]|uniref:2-succinyl-6-hydroxy-2, 4-cyclohexadiene-1-carboxylate synthase n=1 Tax=Thaumasiovibrio subtropicus TaxID=1891207 RepID=UPI000B3558F0|nr:2-succinyl-6-hydroxy-2,4-cyclohexadiene-1-carboxylate synthase [Thaumasiovibrio subtropicus]
MTLYSVSEGSESQPTLVFLHGLLGDSRDWLAIVERMQADYRCVCIDLPGHGFSTSIAVDPQQGFADAHRQLSETLKALAIDDYALVGYSMGARVAMYHAIQQPLGVRSGLRALVLEGGHFGLPIKERKARLNHDQRWADRFAQEPLAEVLDDWYQQPVFAHLNQQQRQALIKVRRRGNGETVAAMMMATSLGHQPLLSEHLNALPQAVYYMVGERDAKFLALADAHGVEKTVIAGAGHNTHAEAPDAFCRALRACLSHHY